MYYHYSKKISLNTRFGNSILPIRGYDTERIFIFKRGQYNTVLSFTLHYYNMKKHKIVIALTGASGSIYKKFYSTN